MNHKEILDLIALFEKSSLEILELNEGEFRLYLKKMNSQVSIIQNQAAAPSVSTVTFSSAINPEPDHRHKVTSPMVGTFYRAANPEAEPFVKIGDTVKKGDVLCIIEAMKMLNEIHADTNGVIAEIPVENGTMVDYGKTLFFIEETNV